MYGWRSEESLGRLTALEERWKIMYNEQHRSPTYSVSHYITYLRRYVADTGHLKTSDKSGDKPARAVSEGKLETRETITKDKHRSKDSISPMSYFIRKLKLDLKMSFPSFVEEFIQPPNNGLRLLLALLKNLQVLSSNPIGSVLRSTPTGTLRMEEYKKNMVDEQDCLLCIKYTLRIQSAVEEILDHNNGLFTVTTCLLSNFLKSRITALEILTLILTGPSSVDKVLDAFTSMRIKYAESIRFKMLINMLHTRGVSQVLFQVSCLRLLNTILNFCKTANMRVYLQYEMEEAGLDWERIQEQGAQGDGLEYDDLRKEIREWKMRYIDVDSMLRKIKADLKGNAVVEYSYDQRYGPMYNSTMTDMEGFHGQGQQMEHNWRQHVEENGHARPQYVHHGPSVYISTQHSNENIARSNTFHTFSQPDLSQLKDRSFPLKGNHFPVEPNEAAPSPLSSAEDLVHTNSNAVHDTLEDSTGNRISITSEICEPYGLIIRKKSPNHSSDNNVGNDTGNWILSQPKSEPKQEKDGVETSHRKQREANDDQRKDDKGDRYDSGFSVDYGEHEVRNGIVNMSWENFYPRNKIVFSEEDQHVNDNAENGEEMNGHRPRTELNSGQIYQRMTWSSSPLSHSEKDVAPMRWYNPGISLPVSPKTSATHRPTNGFFYEPAHGDQYQTDEREKPRTPSPDYNNDDTGVAVDNGTSHKIFYAGVDDQARMHAVDNQPSHFRRLQNIRKKSLPEITKQRQPPSISTPTNGFVPNGQIQSHPGHNKQSQNTSIKKPTQQGQSSQAVVSKNPNLRKLNSELLRPPPPQSLQTHTKYPQRTNSNISSSDIRRKTQVSVSVHNVPNSRPTLSKDNIDLRDTKGQHPQTVHQIPKNTTHQPVPAPRDQKSLSKSSTSVTSNKDIQAKKVIQDKKVENHSEPEDLHHKLNNGVTPLSHHKKTNISTDNSKGNQGNRYNTDMSKVDTEPEKEANQKTTITSQKDDSNSSGVESIRSYSAEIGRVLNDLDQTLETHGWQASLKKHVKQQRPLVAYV